MIGTSAASSAGMPWLSVSAATNASIRGSVVSAYANAGATWLVLTAIGDDWHAQWELIAEAATGLD